VQWAVRGVLIVGLTMWAGWFALPFAQTDLDNPDEVNFARGRTNYTEYLSGYLIGDDAVRSAADSLNQLEPQGDAINANCWLCHLLYFYADQDIVCLDHHTPRSDLALNLRRDIAPGKTAYLALSGYQPFFESLTGVCSEQIADFKHPNIKNEAWHVRIWRLWQDGSCSEG
jgi:hypothetical protein